MQKKFKPQKLEGSLKVEDGENNRGKIVVDYGGNQLKEILKVHPVKLTDCNIEEANLGDIDQQICIAQAYLTVKDCKQAKEWAIKAFEQDKWYEANEPVLDLIGRLEYYGECQNANHYDL